MKRLIIAERLPVLFDDLSRALKLFLRGEDIERIRHCEEVQSSTAVRALIPVGLLDIYVLYEGHLILHDLRQCRHLHLLTFHACSPFTRRRRLFPTFLLLPRVLPPSPPPPAPSHLFFTVSSFR